MYLKRLMPWLLIATLLGGCGAPREKNNSSAPAPAAAPAAAPSAGVSAADAAAEAAKNATESTPTEQMTSSANSTSNEAGRQFIRTADARFAVKDVYQSALAIEDAVQANDGFVTQNKIQTDQVRHESYAKGDGNMVDVSEYTVVAQLIVRVPSAKTQDFLRAIANQIEFLEHRNFEARDAQFEILRQKVETATASTRADRSYSKVSELEFADQVKFATITLDLYQPNKVRQSESVDFDAATQANRPGFFKRLGLSMATGWYALLECVIALMNFWPLWLAGALFFVGWRRWRAYLLARFQTRKGQSKGQSTDPSNTQVTDRTDV